MKRILYLIIICFCSACTPSPKDVSEVDVLPYIFPDYIDVTVPAGIAPLNFNVMDDGVEDVEVSIGSREKASYSNVSKGNLAKFDIEEWHTILSENIGGSVEIHVTALVNGKWQHYIPFNIHISKYALDDYGLTYRRIAPGYEVYSKMGIYQRCLNDFNEEPIIENTVSAGACVNCHSSNATNPKDFTFHVRGEHGATMVQRNGHREWLKARNDSINGSMVYPYWHPSGKFCAYSTNSTHQSFHTIHNERIEVFDDASDVFVYNPETHELILDSLLMTRDYLETYPAFSPDGKTLYFVSSLARNIPAEYKEIRYDLCSIGFDAETQTFDNNVDTLYRVSDNGKSLVFPRPSYDGHWLMFTLDDYGCFPIWHKEADLWLLDLQTGNARAINEVNSEDTESFHNWSSNSHWFVFSSRRQNGLYTQLFLASIDENGVATKPFLLPQKNPWKYYDGTFYSFNVPDFTHDKVVFDEKASIDEINSDKRIPTKIK